jgi:hypothetical protein
MKRKLFVMSVALLCPFFLLSQGINWRTNGNSGIGTNDYLGTKNNADLIFKTNNETRLIIDKDGDVEALGDFRVHGTLFVGDSTIALTDNTQAQTFGWTAEITSGNGRMALGRSSYTTGWFPPSFATNFSLGIGGSHHRHKVHIESQSNNANFEARIGFTNNTTGHNSANLGTTVGLINNSRNFLVNQQENASILFNSSATPRMSIAGNGYVCIGDYGLFTAQRKLDVFDNSNVPQLRLSYGTTSYTDFYTIDVGHLLINPAKGRVGINLPYLGTPTVPTEVLDVNGNGRFRVMPVDNAITDVVVIMPDGTLRRNTVIGSGTGGSDADWFNQNALGVPPTGINDPIYTFNNVAIGANASGPNRTYIYNNEMKTSLFVESISTTSPGVSYSIYSSMNGNNMIGTRYGLRAISTYSNNSNYGVSGRAQGLGQSKNYGVEGTAHGSMNTRNYGVYGVASSDGDAFNFSIYGLQPNNWSNSWAGYFDGNVQVTGSVTLTGTFAPSDEAIKENIESIASANDILSQLNPVEFNYKVIDYPMLRLPDGNHFGLIAQEVAPILPELVKQNFCPQKLDSLGNVITDSLSFLSVDYTSLIPVLIQGFKEQQDSIASLKEIINNYETRFQQIETMLAMCCEDGVAKSQEVEINSTTIAIETMVPCWKTKQCLTKTILILLPIRQHLPIQLAMPDMWNWKLPTNTEGLLKNL